MTTKNWFEARNLKVLDYQQKGIADVQQSMLDREITVLAAAPTAGKTLMSICILEEYLRENPTHKVLVLAHGTTLLKNQYIDDLNEYKPEFSFDVAHSCDDYYEKVKYNSVIVSLPQSISKCKRLNHIDLLLCDEGHEFYFAKNKENKTDGMVTSIIKKAKIDKQLLLTGTPSKFVYAKFKVIPISLNTVHDEGMVSDFYVKIASSSYDFKINDFNTNCELTAPDFKNIDTDKTLDELVKSIVKYLVSIKYTDYENLIPDWATATKSLKKTLFACKSQQQARQVQAYFDRKGISAVTSISDDDLKSTKIEDFKNDKSILILIVVDRGVLGFNYPELVNVVDMTMGHNIDVIYQLLCRIARPYKDSVTGIEDKKLRKLFFKISPQLLTDYYQHVMNVVCMLSDEEYLMKYNGKNFRGMEVIIKAIIKKKHNSNSKKSKSKISKYQPIDMGDMPVFEFFDSIYHKKGELLEVYAKTTMNHIRSEFMKGMPKGFWMIKENVIEDAKKYNTIIEWTNNSASAVNSAREMGWFEECIIHMDELKKRKGYWTIERLLEKSTKFNSPEAWKKGDSASYSYAYPKKDIFKICTVHMTEYKKVNGYWALELVQEDALNFTKKSEWKKNSPAAYQAAYKHGWMHLCDTHMVKKSKSSTKEECLEYSKNKTIKEIRENNPKIYNAICKKNLHKECFGYVKSEGRKAATLEECIEICRNYYNSTELQKSIDSRIFSTIKRNSWKSICFPYFKKYIVTL
jgi:superfamily II DNA or RNA helicase